MPRIRVLVVDDSVVIRRIITDALSADPSVEVVGTAPNGRIALAKITHLNPDVITLDIEMPEMNGIETLREIRKTHPRLPVIMFSTLTERGASATLEALSLGASDYVTKPSNAGSVGAAQGRVRDELVPRIKALCGHPASAHAQRPAGVVAALPARTPRPRPATTGPSRVDIVAIGVSTGGPNALADVLPRVPANFAVPIVVVQHMPPVFTRLLAERLNGLSSVTVREGFEGAVLAPGTVWIAPGDYHMVVQQQRGIITLATHQASPENSCRPAVDVLFRSVAQVFGARALGVVLTGMGQDGFRGCEHLVEAGAQVIAQDRATSVVWGMPGFVANAGLADRVLPLDQIAHDIARRVDEGRHAERWRREVAGGGR